jgi:hypothetical protein
MTAIGVRDKAPEILLTETASYMSGAAGATTAEDLVDLFITHSDYDEDSMGHRQGYSLDDLDENGVFEKVNNHKRTLHIKRLNTSDVAH